MTVGFVLGKLLPEAIIKFSSKFNLYQNQDFHDYKFDQKLGSLKMYAVKLVCNNSDSFLTNSGICPGHLLVRIYMRSS